MAPVDASLQRLDVLLQLLDHGVTLLQILVQPVSLADQLLLPRPESLFLDLDLFRKPLPQRLLLFLELGVVELPRPRLAKLPRLHLLRTVCLVVVLLGRVDEVEHVRSDEDGAELLEVAVLLVLHLGHTPGILTTFDGAAVAGLDISFGANDAEGHGGDEGTSMLQAGFVIFLKRWLVDLDALGFDDSTDLFSSAL